ncbi:OmpA family protein [Roseomonas fluvialis]|uniref:Membrane protein n=1 Tax=Roseomonas fluvialis TaxID=1750527 RepID=A0ABM7Y4Q9_9PROT|nr:OmpA family protein [Roseomonas fluvialis]BDG72876.1 membrane protein [Roseomonas fluvialis]
MSLKKALLAATLLSLPMAATAQAQSWDPRVQGIYVGAGAGFNYLMGSSDTVAGRSLDVGFEWGFAGVLSVGYGFGNGLRLELEGSYRQNDVDNIKASGVGSLPRTGGTAASYGVMFNALYDFRLGPVMPYVGAGVGYVINDWDDISFGQRAANGTNARLSFGGDSGTFAYQAILGIALPIDSVPGLALTAEYRFLGTAQVELDGRANGVVQVGNTRIADREAFSYSADNYNHSIMFGVRYNFGRTAAPVAPAAVAPAPARTFLVFFDWNRADLTARARQIIAEAAQAARTQRVTRIEVTGHTDTSGSPVYNQGLSVRRANAVAAELVRLGIPRNEITARGVGESQLLVPTPDNTREPQNRRVEIVLR